MPKLISPSLHVAASLAFSLAIFAPDAHAQTALDGPERPFQDSLVDQLAGQWFMGGNMGRQQVGYTVTAEWVLNHQFLRFAMRDTSRTPSYEAHVYIGRDNTSDRYVAHWIDVFGGRWSETLGYGLRTGNTIEFLFEYADGPFRTAFTLVSPGVWTVQMRQRAGTGPWRPFAQYSLRRP